MKNSPVRCEAISVPVRLYSKEKWPRWTSFTLLSSAQDSLIARYLRGKRYSLERICIIWCIQVFVLNNRSWVTMKTSARKKKKKRLCYCLPKRRCFTECTIFFVPRNIIWWHLATKYWICQANPYYFGSHLALLCSSHLAKVFLPVFSTISLQEVAKIDHRQIFQISFL